MIFDLSYIINYDWWDYMKRVSLKPLEVSDAGEVYELCRGTFREEYHITEERILESLFEDPDFSAEESKKIVDEKNGRMIGFIGVKVSHNEQLYPASAWISIFAVKKEEQGKGYGTMVLNQVCQSLHKNGINKIYVGQDFNNFFSGIPDPDEGKEIFFKKNGFTLNRDRHFDLEADITDNRLIDSFDTSSFDKEFTVASYKDNKKELLGFLEREFPGKDPESIVILWNQDKTEIVGYCMLSVDDKGYGGLGPIGIAKKIRGKHVGDYILNQSLQQLRKIGAVRVNIDWTILKDFYGQFGFKAERLYLAAYKEFDK